MIEKPWSYKQITAAAEKSILGSMTLAAKATEPLEAMLHWRTAWGVFRGWESLTMGWQQKADAERLEAATLPPKRDAL
jgi:hypothetical protein